MPLKGSETKGYLLLGRKAVTNLDSILKSRDSFTDKGPYSQPCTDVRVGL